MFDDIQNRMLSRGVGSSVLAPLDVKETDKNYEVMIDLPGAKKEEISVNIRDNVLSIGYERKSTKKEKGMHLTF
jgi:HSP20 family molecular chaperone IbpA